eukprot:2700788-Pleurochrysis_carterae.AAC.2
MQLLPMNGAFLCFVFPAWSGGEDAVTRQRPFSKIQANEPKSFRGRYWRLAQHCNLISTLCLTG